MAPGPGGERTWTEMGWAMQDIGGRVDTATAPTALAVNDELNRILADPEERVAVVVIHGVGDTPPGWINRAIVDRLRAVDMRLETQDHAEFHEFEDRGSSKPGTVFPVYVRRARVAGIRRIAFHELYWADLSKTGGGPAMSLLVALKLFYEAPFILAHSLMAGQRSGWHWTLKRLVLLATWLLRWPIAGMNTTAFVVYLVVLGLSSTGLLPPLPFSVTIIAILVPLALLSFGIARWRMHRDLWATDVAMATGLTSVVSIVVISGLFVLLPRHLQATPGALLSLAMLPILYIWVLWSLVITLAIGMLVPVAAKRALGFRPARYFPLSRPAAALALALLQGLIWKVLMTLPGVWLIDAIAALPAQAVPTELPALQPLLRSLEMLFSGEIMRCAAPGHALIEAACAALTASSHEALEDATSRLKGVFVFNSLHALYTLIAIVGVILIRVAVARAPILERNRLRFMPRIILSPVVILMLFAGSLGNLYIYWAGLYQSEFFLQNVPGVQSVWLGPPLAAAIFVILYFFNIFQTVSASVLHIFRDVVDHQYRPRFKTLEFLLPSDMRAKSDWPRRARVGERMNVLVESLIRGRAYDRLVLVGHSQGSVILFDYLQSAEDNADLVGIKFVDVVTVGSPLTHIYQRYFNEYGTAKPTAADLNPRLRSWTNLFRLDDPVGLSVDIVAGGFIQNIQLPPGGHLGYWREPAVLAVLLKLITDGTGQPVDVHNGGSETDAVPALAPASLVSRL